MSSEADQRSEPVALNKCGATLFEAIGLPRGAHRRRAPGCSGSGTERENANSSPSVATGRNAAGEASGARCVKAVPAGEPEVARSRLSVGAEPADRPHDNIDKPGASV